MTDSIVSQNLVNGNGAPVRNSATNNANLPLGSGARFIARGIDVHKNLPDVLKAAHAHKGAAFVEIYQNCIVYNDDVFAPFTAKENAGNQLWLKAGEPMLFAGGTKGLALDTERLALKVVEGDDPAVLVHDPKNKGVAKSSSMIVPCMVKSWL